MKSGGIASTPAAAVRETGRSAELGWFRKRSRGLFRSQGLISLFPKGEGSATPKLRPIGLMASAVGLVEGSQEIAFQLAEGMACILACCNLCVACTASCEEGLS